MAISKIHVLCNTCGNEWTCNWPDVYRPHINTCPNCGAVLDRDIWENIIAPTAKGALDCGMELQRRAAKNQDGPAFMVKFDWK